MAAEEVDERMAALAQGYAERAEPLPPGRWGTVTRADLDATRFRIIHGKALDLSSQGVLPYPLTEEESFEAGD